MTPKRREQLRQKLLEACGRLEERYPRLARPLNDLDFYALKPLFHMSIGAGAIYVDPDWLWKLDPGALDFLLLHQLLHLGLGHTRRSSLYRGDRFHLACDIVVNSHLRQLGWTAEKLTGVGTVYHKTFFPVQEGRELTVEEAFAQVPMDPAALSPAARRRYRIDDEACWGLEAPVGELLLGREDRRKVIPGPAPFRGRAERDPGCPRPVMRQSLPQEDSFDPEEPEAELIAVIESIMDAQQGEQRRSREAQPQELRPARTAGSWETAQKASLKAIREDLARSLRRAEEHRADQRFWQQTNRTCLDWRLLLDAFLQQEVCDYSFLPPDRRYPGDFFLPDFSEYRTVPLKVLFLVDTSGSVSDDRLSAVYTELRGALEQFNGSLTGWVGFFDTRVYPLTPFSDDGDLRRLRPVGGGGTDLGCAFRDCADLFGDESLSCVVILTDGQGDFPEEAESRGIPVLWLLTDSTVRPPWGRAAWLDS